MCSLHGGVCVCDFCDGVVDCSYDTCNLYYVIYPTVLLLHG